MHAPIHTQWIRTSRCLRSQIRGGEFGYQTAKPLYKLRCRFVQVDQVIRGKHTAPNRRREIIQVGSEMGDFACQDLLLINSQFFLKLFLLLGCEVFHDVCCNVLGACSQRHRTDTDFQVLAITHPTVPGYRVVGFGFTNDHLLLLDELEIQLRMGFFRCEGLLAQVGAGNKDWHLFKP